MGSTLLITKEGQINDSDGEDNIRRTSRYSFLEKVCPGLLLAGDILVWLWFLGAVQQVLQGRVFDYSLFAVPSLVTVVCLCLIGGYDRRTDFLSLSYASEHLIALGAAALFSALAVYLGSAFQIDVKPSRALIPLLFMFFAVISWLLRRMLGTYLNRLHSTRILFVLGDGERADRFVKDYGISDCRWPIKATPLKAGGDDPQSMRDGYQLHDDLELTDYSKCEAIVLACDLGTLPPGMLRELAKLHCSNIPVMTVEAFHEKRWRRVNVDAIKNEWLFDGEFKLAHDSLYSNFKRVFDVVVAASALIVLSPLLLLLCILIRMESRGPAIFRQDRVGREGRVFTMFKFRSMRENDGEIYTRKGDSRITRLGRLLRVSRLDELPQLWNVLVRDMSIIGPRAEWVKCAEIYERDIPNYHLRHFVHPGITGWAQVNFSYGESRDDAVEKFQFDLYYIRHFSLLLDVSIVLKTMHTIIGGKGR